MPWLLVRYEDFVARPRETLNAIADHAGHPAEAPFVDEHTARVHPTHGVGGNPSKFSLGDVKSSRTRSGRRRCRASTAG